ncbi:MAG: hypothetical protein DSZ07_03080 [Sulfurovum sp.]|nr:MAG: hypothetical protein DSZ07_03080 [Sulfurovum sp.]
MALRGKLSQSFLRSKDLLSFSEISHDREGNNILKNSVLAEALARDNNGKFIRNKANIANILNKYGIIYRMVFNAMNMEQYTYDEVQEALDHLSEYINDFGVSGIVEFHASDKTQNSDHIHFWISSEDTIIYNKIAQEMVAMGYSNEEDVYIQKYEDNKKLDETEYVRDENRTINERFAIKSMGMEAGETLDSINKMLSIDKVLYKSEPTLGALSSFYKKYNLTLDNISNLFKEVIAIKKNIQNENKVDISIDCTLAKTNETTTVLSRIKELKEDMNRE